MTEIRSNEREFMSQVISWINESLKDGSYPFEVASSDPDSFITRIPRHPTLIEQAVFDYERYLKELKAKLFEAFFSRTHNHKQSDLLAQKVFVEMELPDV